MAQAVRVVDFSEVEDGQAYVPFATKYTAAALVKVLSRTAHRFAELDPVLKGINDKDRDVWGANPPKKEGRPCLILDWE